MTTPHLVLIEWEDATAVEDDRWVEVKKEYKYTPAMIQTVGFLLHDSDQGVIVTAHWNEDHTGPVDQIPRGMIRRVKRLK
jgi:hypothetical protein